MKYLIASLLLGIIFFAQADVSKEIVKAIGNSAAGIARAIAEEQRKASQAASMTALCLSLIHI